MQPVPGPSARRTEVLALVAPLALAAAAYARTLRGEFQLDDVEAIVDNGAIKAFWPWLRGLLDVGTLASGRPLTTLTFAANYALGRLDPLGYHVVNLALHLCATLLVALLGVRVAALAGAERPRRIAVAAAGLFAVHPLQSEAVSYVSQRAEVLASALYVTTLLLLLATPRGRLGVVACRAAAFATFVLGLAAKPIVLTVPAAYLAVRLAAAPRAASEERAEWRTALWPLAPVIVAGGAFAAALLVALRGRPDAGFSVAGTSPWLYLLTQLRAVVVYLRLLAWPAGQSVDWDFPTSPGLADPATLGAALVVLALAGGAALLLVRGRREAGRGGVAARLAGLGIAWFLVLLAPTSSIVPLADNLVEHRVYLASWGAFLAAVAAADALAARLRAAKLAAGAWVAAVLVLAVALHRRNAVWETREALWADVLARTPRAARARANLADALESQGRTDEAIRQYQLALACAEGNVGRQARIHLSLGNALMTAGRTEEARRSFAEGLHFLPNDDGLLVGMAMAAGASGDAGTAESLARRALTVNPAQPASWVVLGNLALEREDWPGALSSYDRAVAMDPDRGEAHYGRALALGVLGRTGEECAALRAALQAFLSPRYRASIEAEVRERCR